MVARLALALLVSGCAPVTESPSMDTDSPGLDLQLAPSFHAELDRGFACDTTFAGPSDTVVLLNASATMRLQMEHDGDGNPTALVFLGENLDAVFDTEPCDDVGPADPNLQTVLMAYSNTQGTFTHDDTNGTRTVALEGIVLAPDTLLTSFPALVDYTMEDAADYQSVSIPDTILGPVVIGNGISAVP